MGHDGEADGVPTAVDDGAGEVRDGVYLGEDVVFREEKIVDRVVEEEFGHS